jgi:hypothetical protein
VNRDWETELAGNEIVDTKFEYEFLPEQAEKMALEYATMESYVFRRRRALACLLSGIFAGLILISFVIPSRSESESKDSGYFMLGILFSGVVGAAICLGMGFLSEKLIQISVRQNLARRIRLEVRKYFPRTERRTVSWSQEALALSSPTWDTKIKWQAIDEILVVEIGIHISCDGRVIFSIPRIALPPGWSAEALVATWRSYISASKQVTQ